MSALSITLELLTLPKRAQLKTVIYRFQKTEDVKNDINISAHPFHLCISFQMSKNTMGKKRAPLYTRNKNKEKNY
jgi:hypothetical protein